MGDDYETILMIKTAWYYYIENLTQQGISDILGISRMRVIRLLEKARQTGVIQFNIRKDSTERIQVEKRLGEAFGLKDVFVVPDAAGSDQSVVNVNIARAAAMYINDRLEDNRYINVGYGDTPSRVLNELATIAEEPVSCISLTGGVNNYLANMQSNVFNARLYLIPAPLLASTPEMAAAIRNEPSVGEIYRMVASSAYTVVGVGGLNDDATIFKSGILNHHDQMYLKMQGAVGDVLSHFVDKDGSLVHTATEDRLISTPLETMKKLRNVVGVAAGPAKVEAIHAALLGKYVDVLITDERTAGTLLDGVGDAGENRLEPIRARES
ncbi:MAG: sugar-binding transcriptional regulator [Planctomycetota bacterium]|jgi:DNA-binding transcriptional regulator LsrR (DeoR family)|nr:sugar-binding transcriptional regulator [Planctomycetota bacterium]